MVPQAGAKATPRRQQGLKQARGLLEVRFAGWPDVLLQPHGSAGITVARLPVPHPSRVTMSGDSPSERCSWWSLVPPERRLLEEYWSQVIESFGITGCLMLGIYKETVEITSTWYPHAGDNPSSVFGRAGN